MTRDETSNSSAAPTPRISEHNRLTSGSPGFSTQSWVPSMYGFTIEMIAQASAAAFSRFVDDPVMTLVLIRFEKCFPASNIKEGNESDAPFESRFATHVGAFPGQAYPSLSDAFSRTEILNRCAVMFVEMPIKGDNEVPFSFVG